MKHRLTIFLLLQVFFVSSFGQEKSSDPAGDGNLWLNFKNINFVRNNEYRTPVTEGYTLIGYFIQPSLVYSPSDKVRLQLGTHIVSYSGAEKISKPKLLFSTTYNFSENTRLTLGTLSGCEKHRLFDPHFDSERIYTAYHEDGFQFVTDKKYLFSDTWLSWENFIFKGDSTREVFTAGESFRYTTPKLGSMFSMEFPLQVQFKHYGGEISNYTGHVTTYFNLSGGARLNFDFGGRLGTAAIEYDHFIFNELTGKGDIGITDGYASWFRFHYTNKSVYFGSYYWKSKNFFAPNGNVLYGSVSDFQSNVIIPGRRIWTNSLYLTVFPADYLEIFFGFDGYYNLDKKHMDTSLTLHLNFNKLIRLAALK
jgi:hypothetical protein